MKSSSCISVVHEKSKSSLTKSLAFILYVTFIIDGPLKRRLLQHLCSTVLSSCRAYFEVNGLSWCMSCLNILTTHSDFEVFRSPLTLIKKYVCLIRANSIWLWKLQESVGSICWLVLQTGLCCHYCAKFRSLPILESKSSSYQTKTLL